MKHSKILLAIALVVSMLIPSGMLKAEVNQATINYLRAASQSAWITQALKAAGQNNLGLDYLNGLEMNNANEVAKTILAIVAAGQNPYSYQNQNYVSQLLNYYNNNQLGSTQLLNDDFWGIIALRSSGEPTDSVAVIGAKNFIVQNQNDDGGWSWAPDSESDTNDTAAAIMALLEAGLTANAQTIQSAVSYLRESQNNDGGFPFAGGESDSGSDSWVIAALNKLGINPTTWQKNNHQPVLHLQSLMLENGSFKWLASDEQGNLGMTAFAVVALAGASYPVAVYQAAEDVNVHHLRIEGSQQTVCNAQVEGVTPQEVLENGAEICDYDYHIQSTDWGPYLDRINNDQAEGQIGWLYRVNWHSPEVGMAEYHLAQGDEVLFYYAHWQDVPLRISLSASNVEANQQLTATVEFFNEQDWQAQSGALAVVGEHQFQTNNQGQATFAVAEEGGYLVFAQKQGAVRSASQVLLVGRNNNTSVVLEVDVANNNGREDEEEDEEDQEAVAFTINTNSLDFGNLRPGESLVRSLTIANQSGHDLYVEGVVEGDDLFERNLLLNNRIWENYSQVLAREQSAQVNVHLVIPQNYRSGYYQANLVIWASAR